MEGTQGATEGIQEGIQMSLGGDITLTAPTQAEQPIAMYTVCFSDPDSTVENIKAKQHSKITCEIQMLGDLN